MEKVFLVETNRLVDHTYKSSMFMYPAGNSSPCLKKAQKNYILFSIIPFYFSIRLPLNTIQYS